MLDEIALSAEEGGRDPSDAPRYKGLKQKARHAAAVLADAEIECGTPKERELATLTDASEAAKAALGPKMAAKAIAKAALAESIAALAALPASTDLQHRTKVRHAVAMIERELARAEDDLAKAEAMYNETIRPVVSARISTMLVESAALFDDQYAQIEQAAVEDMVSAAEDIANVGGLAPGDVVHVDVGGAFVKAKVVGACPNRPKPGGEEEGPVSYDVLLEEETTLLGSEYSKEFKTPVRGPPLSPPPPPPLNSHMPDPRPDPPRSGLSTHSTPRQLQVPSCNRAAAVRRAQRSCAFLWPALGVLFHANADDRGAAPHVRRGPRAKAAGGPRRRRHCWSHGARHGSRQRSDRADGHAD